MPDTQPVVSICCITYNHEKYIRDAIEGFLMQETDFPIEIIIHDDASTDSTADIIREYAIKHPSLIKPIFQSQNQFSQGKRIIPEYLYPKTKGKYIAFCEGDDYWTSSQKLQRQVEYMEANPECLLCFHGFQIIWEERPDIPAQAIYPLSNVPNKVDGFHSMQFGTFLYRKTVPFPSWFLDLRASFEWPLITWVLMQGGKIGYVAGETMSVYRKHQYGISTQPAYVTRGLNKLHDYQLVTQQMSDRQRRDLFHTPLHGIHLYLCRAYLNEGNLHKARHHFLRYVYYKKPVSRPEISKALKLGVQCYMPITVQKLKVQRKHKGNR